MEVRGHSCSEPLARERSWCLHADTAPQCNFPRQRSATHVGNGCHPSKIVTDVLVAKLSWISVRRLSFPYNILILQRSFNRYCDVTGIVWACHVQSLTSWLLAQGTGW